MARISADERISLERSVRDGLKKFYFSNAAIDRVLKESGSHQLQELDGFLGWELENRCEARKQRLVKQAGFPILKDLDDFIYDEVKMPETLTRVQMTDLDFIRMRHSLIMYGICGSGKTMLSIALGFKACQAGYAVRFTTLAQLATRLMRAHDEGRLDSYISDFRNLDLLIIDEWGYCQLDKRSAELVFQVISDSYEHKSLILTTNLPFSEWGKIVTDEQLAAAMIDRIVHYGHLINTGNVDWRLRQSPMNRQMTSTKVI